MQRENRETHNLVYDGMIGHYASICLRYLFLLLVTLFFLVFLDAKLSYTNTAAIACSVQFVYICGSEIWVILFFLGMVRVLLN